MKAAYFLICALAMILIMVSAGCVAPPTEKSLGSIGSSSNGQGTDVTTAPPSYVTEETLADIPRNATTPLGYSNFVPTTQIPADIACQIYTKTAAYGFNGSAFSFDLKNPPMYIQYTVIPTNITVTKVVSPRTGTKGDDITLTYSDYSPTSWFEITVSNKTSGNVYLQDGFGTAKGYPTYLNRTLKILNRDTMFVELKGNDIKATATIWVKPIGNFNDTEIPTFTTCSYMDQNRASIPTPVQTTYNPN